MTSKTKNAALGILALFFLAGVVSGCIYSTRLSQDENIILAEQLTSLVYGGFSEPSFAYALLSACMYPMMCFLFGLTLLGVIAIPGVIAVRGFFLSYTICSFIKVFGAGGGIALSLALFAPSIVLTMPCLMMLGINGTVTSLTLLNAAVNRGTRPITAPVVTSRLFARLGICIAVFIVSALAEVYISPWLCSLAIKWLGI